MRSCICSSMAVGEQGFRPGCAECCAALSAAPANTSPGSSAMGAAIARKPLGPTFSSWLETKQKAKTYRGCGNVSVSARYERELLDSSHLDQFSAPPARKPLAATQRTTMRSSRKKDEDEDGCTIRRWGVVAKTDLNCRIVV